MSEQQPKVDHDLEQESDRHNVKTLLFMVALSFICALILSVLASVLAKPKEIAKELDRSVQMMIAAKILSHEGTFLMKTAEGTYIPAKYMQDGLLEPSSAPPKATRNELMAMYSKRIVPLLVNSAGEVFTFEQAKLVPDSYIAAYKRSGYFQQPYKLVYKVLPQGGTEAGEPSEYVIPINGYGLWDAIYGYLAIKPDGNTIIGTTWYDQKETPGLGANIADPPWQSLFPNKLIFQESADGKTNFKTAPLGITVVKGRVSEVLGDSPKAKSAVDGMAGATLTGNGVTEAFQKVLAAYRPFLIKLHEDYVKQHKEE